MTFYNSKPEIKTFEDYLNFGCMRCKWGNTPNCKVNTWKILLIEIRNFLLNFPLQETIKWGVPCYMYKKRNELLLSAFKEYVALSFLNGHLLTDDENLLVIPGPNTQKARVIKFTSVEQFYQNKERIIQFVQQAIHIAHEPTVAADSFSSVNMNIPCKELEYYFSVEPDFKNAFEKLTPGRKRGYYIYFNSAKNTDTIKKRIEKCKEKIFSGKGLHE